MISSSIKSRAYSAAWYGPGKNTGLIQEGFEANYTRQDAAILNILRACEQAIDLANYVIKKHKLGIPTASAESFELLRQKSIIEAHLAEKLKKMVHFRNTVIHQYQQTDVSIVEAVIISGLDDLIQFGDRILTFLREPASRL